MVVVCLSVFHVNDGARGHSSGVNPKIAVSCRRSTSPDLFGDPGPRTVLGGGTDRWMAADPLEGR